ncbi:MAG: hypothetical protein LBS73_06650 [Campylobacteraceae bacterium]|jgi:tetratricopeptide (TPR) repeat protein|nr:hypothetical protein [Campylobacteraceae bacterium]
MNIFKIVTASCLCAFFLGGVLSADTQTLGKRDANKLIKPPKENKIRIDTNRVQNIDELIRKFNKKADFSLAANIAEEYFDIEEYENSLKWTLNANDLDASSEFTWILYAKNQVKLGNRDKAIEMLSIFLNHYKDTPSATQLLEWIRTDDYE